MTFEEFLQLLENQFQGQEFSSPNLTAIEKEIEMLNHVISFPIGEDRVNRAVLFYLRERMDFLQDENICNIAQVLCSLGREDSAKLVLNAYLRNAYLDGMEGQEFRAQKEALRNCGMQNFDEFYCKNALSYYEGDQKLQVLFFLQSENLIGIALENVEQIAELLILENAPNQRLIFPDNHLIEICAQFYDDFEERARFLLHLSKVELLIGINQRDEALQGEVPGAGEVAASVGDDDFAEVPRVSGLRRRAGSLDSNSTASTLASTARVINIGY